MINPATVVELMTDYVNEVYALVEGQYPKASVDEWRDKVRIAHKVALGDANDIERQFFAAWHADPTSNTGALAYEDYVQSLIGEELKYVGLRQKLNQLYKQSLYGMSQLDLTNNVQVSNTISAVFGNARQLNEGIAGSNVAMREQLAGILNEMHTAFTEAMTTPEES